MKSELIDGNQNDFSLSQLASNPTAAVSCVFLGMKKIQSKAHTALMLTHANGFQHLLKSLCIKKGYSCIQIAGNIVQKLWCNHKPH